LVRATLSAPHSDAFFIKAYPAGTTEAFCDGHVAAFAFSGGVPLSILHDNTTMAVAKILGDGTRQRPRIFSELPSPYLFEDRSGRPGKGNDKGNDKGNVEAVIGFGRRNFLVPMPRFESFEALNAWLEEQCLKRQDAVLRGHTETIGERRLRDLDALMVLSAAPCDACDKVSTRATSISMVRYRGNDYSVPVAFAHHEVQVRGHVGEVVIGAGTDVIARHRRSCEKADMVVDPMPFLPRLAPKVGALDQAAPLPGWELPQEFATLSSPRCAGCSRPGWRSPANAGPFRSCGASRASRWIMSMAPSARLSTAGRLAATRSNTWCCAASSGARRGSISTAIAPCRGHGSRPRSRRVT
jgi:hypothetical protein